MKLSCEISSKLSKQLFCARHLHKVRLEDVKRVETRDSTFACSPLLYIYSSPLFASLHYAFHSSLLGRTLPGSSLRFSTLLFSTLLLSTLLCSTLLSSLSLCLSPLLSRVWLSISCPIHSMPVYHVYIYIYVCMCVCVCECVCVWVCVLCFKWGLKSLITRDSHLALQPLLMDSATKAAPRRELTGKSSRKSYPLQDLLAYKSRILDCNDFWLSFQTIYILFGIWETFFQVWDSSLIYTGQWFP